MPGVRTGWRPRGAALAGAGAAALWVGVGLAQDRAGEAAPNPSLTADLELGLEAEDGEAGLRADIGLSYLTRTRTQALALRIGTGLELDGDGLGDDAFLPEVRLRYGVESGAAALELTAAYRLREVDGLAFALDPGDPDFDEVDLVEDDSRLETVRAGLTLALWRDAPVGLELGADLTRRTYRGTSDPDLDDSRRSGLEAALRLTPRPGLDFRLTAARDASEDDGRLERETETLRLGGRVTWAATPATTVDLALAWSEREETRNAFAVVGDAIQLTGGRERLTTDGPVFEGALRQRRPNGSRGLRFSRRLTDDGSITDLELGRALDLPRGAALDLGLGAAHFEDGETILVGRLSYARPLPGGAGLTAALSRSAGTDGDDQDVARTRADLSWRRPLTPVSDLTVSAGLARLDVIDGFEPDATAATVSVGYSRALTPDWSLRARYAHDASRTDGAGTERENRFSLGLGRSFAFRP